MPKKLAVVFAGQGSQRLGMLDTLAIAYPLVKTTFAQASAALGYDLWQLCQTGPLEQLNETQFTQPALLAAGVATWRVWCADGGCLPAYMAGHSLGEYTALVCAAAMDFETAIKLVARRGQFMQMAMPEGQGAMAAIVGLDTAAVAEICLQAAQGDIVAPANFNAPGQVVISGTRTAIERAIILAQAQGAKLALKLPVSVPSHCELMRPAAAQLATLIENIRFKTPLIPILHNVDAKAYQRTGDIKQALISQLYSPVRWINTIQALVKQGVTSILECGPGKVLLNLNKRIDQNIENLTIFDAASLAQSKQALAAEL